MTVLTGAIDSKHLARKISFTAIIPIDRPRSMPLRTLYLLNGWGENHDSWLYYTTIIRLAEKFQLAVIMPDGANSFYLDHASGDAYGKFYGQELVEKTRQLFPLSDKREDTFIGGLSMGGYGALRLGYHYQDTFSKVMSFSGRILTSSDKLRDNGIDQRLRHYLEVDSFEQLPAEVDIYQVIKQAARDETELLLTCGTEDFLFAENQTLHEWLSDQGIKHTFRSGAGSHTWPYWEEILEPAIRWLRS